MTQKNKRKVKGIGGWLILPMIGFVITIIVCLLDIMEGMQLYYLEDVYFYILLDFGVIFLSATTLYMLFKKKVNAPKWAIASIIVAAILNILFGLYFAIPGAIIWILYFLKSERIKNTMVN